MKMSDSNCLSKNLKFLPSTSDFRKGAVFLYKHRGRQFGGVVLEVCEGACSYYLIAISEEVGNDRNIDAILRLPLYTVAWFSEYSMLPRSRIHILGLVNIKKDLTNQYGICVSPTIVEIKNCGQRATWAHLFRSFAQPNTTLLDMLS